MQKQMHIPAKINLTLEILGKRKDNYHNLRSLMQGIGIFDKISINITNDKNISLSCDKANIPVDENNICFKAAHIFFKNTHIQNPGLSIDIEKNIPSQAGLGGGSADAAATFILLNDMFNTKLADQELSKIAVKVGADVPFCLTSGLAKAEGIGEILTPLESALDYFLLVVKPDINISTKKAYEIIDSSSKHKTDFTSNAVNAFIDRDLGALCENIHNDFEDALELEAVIQLKNTMRKFNALASGMSGSGSAVFSIFKNKDEANLCAEFMSKSFKEVFVCEPVKNIK